MHHQAPVHGQTFAAKVLDVSNTEYWVGTRLEILKACTWYSCDRDFVEWALEFLCALRKSGIPDLTEGSPEETLEVFYFKSA